MKQIPLTQGKYALVDDSWFEILNQWKWCYGDGYARRGFLYKGKIKTVFMHRIIMKPHGKQIVDHINGNGLDNRSANLRLCNTTQNNRNQHKRSGSSKYKGVYWHKRNQKWQSTIRVNNKSIYIGQFDNEEIPALIYDLWATDIHGKFARTNYPIVSHS